jgi:hypothetical protein
MERKSSLMALAEYLANRNRLTLGEALALQEISPTVGFLMGYASLPLGASGRSPPHGKTEQLGRKRSRRGSFPLVKTEPPDVHPSSISGLRWNDEEMKFATVLLRELGVSIVVRPSGLTEEGLGNLMSSVHEIVFAEEFKTQTIRPNLTVQRLTFKGWADADSFSNILGACRGLASLRLEDCDFPERKFPSLFFLQEIAIEQFRGTKKAEDCLLQIKSR